MRLRASEALAARGVEVDQVKIWQTVGKLRRRHGLVMSGEPREPGYRIGTWTWVARRVRSSVKGGERRGTALGVTVVVAPFARSSHRVGELLKRGA